ncbi:FAD-binding protein [Corynebacterium glutamicum]|uniref:FAD-binding protein n=1 Tax=Corynebacterium glutamicum TaxID=1718 RepID=UPI0009449E1B|nr:FAD-binding protein [Corynebacterium glutamicum]OKX89025.1 FAD-binding protein [Corynebacterium glutamicum]QDX76467.1 FAD-binding protein [Corynebacterium glutamicum]QDX79245.1 FAD-binding protein [Corynebacterium glutamicum]TWS36496.1 FAD-binding protein [Corynebacterium glutamicum]TWS36859.1 FAD-binding protein [Corynebacterium glutamicum]
MSKPLLSSAADWPEELDVLVLGSGCAGMTAALVAADGGALVGVVEKHDKLGGTTAAGGGVMWAPNNHLMGQRGFTDSEEAAAEYIRAATKGKLSDEEIAWYIKNSAEAVLFLDEKTRVDYAPLNRPDYHREWPGSTEGGRGLDHKPFDPSVVPGLVEAVRQPTYLPLITMDERDHLHGAAPDPQLLKDRANQGVRTMGGALSSAMIASAWDSGIRIAAGTAASSLQRTESGWEVLLIDASLQRTITAKHVVIASGGFEWSKELTSTLLKFPITPISAPSNIGDGLKLGIGVGAAFTETTDIWGVPVITAHGAEYDGQQSGRMGNVEATLPGSIVVNNLGKRFVNEALNYHDFSRVFANIDPEESDFANIPAYLVMDSSFTSKYPVAGNPTFTSGAEAPAWMVQADTVEELAGKLGVDAAGLASTVSRFNDDARTGVDSEFGRGATEQDRHLGDPANTPNPCLAPLESGPFYAIELHPGVLGTAGGLQTDLDGEVLGWDGLPLGGLYAAGNCSATVFKDAYPGGGATIGSAITRAYAVGKHISQSFQMETTEALSLTH